MRVSDRAGTAESTAEVGSVRTARRVLRAPAAVRVSDDGLSQAISFAAGPILFGLVGWLIDRANDTGYLFLVIFAIFGLIGTCASFYYRYQAQIARQDEGKPWTRRTH